MIALRIILFLVILASVGVIAVGEMKLKPILEDLKDKEKKVTEELGKSKDESSKQKTRAEKAELDFNAEQGKLIESKKLEMAALEAAEAEKKKAAAAGQETIQAKQDVIKADQRATDYIELGKIGLTPTVIRRINEELPKSTNENNTLKIEQRVTMTELIKKTGELNAIQNPKGAVVLPTGLVGKVAAFDPKWDFVVLNIGANHGLLQNGEMIISREGKLIARVKISKVNTDYAIANVVRGFKVNDIREGDDVLTPSSMVLPTQK